MSTMRLDRAEQGAVDDAPVAPHYLIELAGDLYAIPQPNRIKLSWVQRPQEPTYLPTLPAWCLGLVNERNTPVLLIDPRALLGLPVLDRQGPGDHARHVFMECDGDVVGLLVDRTHRFRLLQPLPTMGDEEFVVGAVRSGERTVRTLNIEAIWRFVLRELGASGANEAVA